MPYQQHIPSSHLSTYIDAYWVRTTVPGSSSPGRRVYADGCADIIVNTGDTTAMYHPKANTAGAIPLQPGHMYLGGTMTAYGIVTAPDGCTLTGIRFRPGGFYALYGQPMAPAVDTLLPFTDERLLPHIERLLPLMDNEALPVPALDAYFTAKKIKTRRDFSAIYTTIYDSKGQISVETLSRDCHMTNRTMERVFKENVGIPPKEFILIVRFQEVLSRLRQADTDERPATRRESLLRIAFELGYHDHAHLTNAFKKYAGILPSELSRFYKTGIAPGQYF